MMRRISIATVIGMVGVAVVTALAGCSSSQGTAQESNAPSSSVYRGLPDDVKASGKVMAASSFTTAPLYYLNEDKKRTGLFVDLVKSAAKVLGVTVEWKQIPYAGMIPALNAGQAALGVVQVTRTPDNADAANFLAVFKNSTGILTRKDSKFSSIDDICGNPVATTNSSVLQQVANDIKSKCVKDGKAAIDIQSFSSYENCLTALRSKRVNAMVNATSQQIYTAKSVSGLKVLDEKLNPTDTGFILAKDQTKLAEAFKYAINKLMHNGTYDELLKKYDLTDMAIKSPVLNG